MKLFDYKLILLIALTFVIYFMYRELQSLNQRVDNVEKKVDDESLKRVEKEQPKFIDFNKHQNNELEFIPESQEVDQISFTNNNLEKKNTDLNSILPNKSCTISTEDEDSEELQIMNQNNILEAEDAVEIYSNDNIEDISSQKTSISEDMIIEDDDINQVNRIVEDINLTPSSESPILEMIVGDDNNLILDENIQNKPEKEQSDEKEKIASQKISDENEEETKIVFNVDNLVKTKKLNELKSLATNLNIELRSNGKAKTKKQLAQDICNSQNSQ